jgi:hypothetical protein
LTLVSTIIQNAFRETNIVPVGQNPTTNQQSEALDRLNAIVLSTIGNEVGDDFTDLNIGGNYDQSTYTTTWVPDNARLIFNLNAATTFNLDPNPYEGQRLAFVDVGNNLASHSVTLNGNGRLIEGASSLTLSTNGDSRQWFYRADTGTWTKVNSLLTSDQMPFPQEFDDYFVTTLAMRLQPRYSQQLPSETLETLKRSRDQIRARYHNYKQVQSDLTTFGWLSDPRNWNGYYTNPTEFNTGKPFPFI